MNILYFTGNVGKDAELREVSGTDVCNFNVAVKQGFKQDSPTEWYRVAVWGTRAKTLAPLITKGAKVAVCGELEIGSYEGKPQFSVRAYEVDPFCGGKRDDQPAQAAAPAERRAPAFAADLDDDVPF